MLKIVSDGDGKELKGVFLSFKGNVTLQRGDGAWKYLTPYEASGAVILSFHDTKDLKRWLDKKIAEAGGEEWSERPAYTAVAGAFNKRPASPP